jgi:ferrous iron transport protein A
MSDERQISLTQMVAGQSGIVAEIRGGYGLVNRLSALGVRPGKRITKLSSIFMRGPVIIQVDRAEMALGFGMARRIIVEVD